MPTSISLAVIDGRVFLIDADNHVGVCGVPSFATHHAAEIILNSEGFANDPMGHSLQLVCPASGCTDVSPHGIHCPVEGSLYDPG